MNFGIGQGYLLVTPLQPAHMAAILAMRGKSLQAAADRRVSRTGLGQGREHQAGAARNRRGHARELEGRHRRHGEGDERTRHRPAQPGRRRIPDRRQDRHGAGVHRRPERKIQREGPQRTPARPWLVHRVRAGGCAEDRRGRDHRERQTWHGGRGDRAPRARPVPARPHHDAGDSAHRRRRRRPTRPGDE